MPTGDAMMRTGLVGYGCSAAYDDATARSMTNIPDSRLKPLDPPKTHGSERCTAVLRAVGPA